MSTPDTADTVPEAGTDLDTVDSIEGIVIDERYEVGREIGSGGFGVVHLARQIALDRRVVVKALHASVAADATNLKRFFVEARAASSIQHPNIVEVIDFGELPSGVPYLVMEHLEGRDLGRVLHDTGPMRWSRARGVLLQVLAALKAAHAAGILHRDIKTSNVIVRESDGPLRVDFVKLVDFGVAKFIDEKRGEDRITAAAFVIGTAAYLAPELVKGVDPNPRTEVYAVGVLAFKMLTGRVPFLADDFLGTLRLAATAPLPDLHELAPDVTEGVKRAIVRALARDPNERYASIAELEAAILSLDAAGRAAASGPTGTAVPGPRPTLERRVRELETERERERKRGRARFALVIALAAGGIAATWWLTRAKEEVVEETPAATEPSPRVVLDDPPRDDPPPDDPPTIEPATPAVPPPDVPIEAPEIAPAPAPVVDKPKRKPRATPSTDADVLTRLERALRSSCDAGGVTIKFTVKSNGRAGMVRVDDGSNDADRRDCIVSKVRAAKFPAGELRALKLAL